MDEKAFITWCTVRRGLSPSSVIHTEIRLKYLTKWLVQRSLTPEAIEEFIAYLIQRRLRNSSVNGYLRVIYLIDLFHKENGVELNLMKRVAYLPKQERVPTIMTIDEIEALLAASPPERGRLGRKSAYTDELFKLTLYIMASTGCRFDEMASLKKESLSLGLDDSWILFKDTKNKQDRRVPIPSILSYKLSAFVRDKGPTEYIFLSHNGNKLNQSTYNPILRNYADNAGLSGKHIHSHAFRHSYIMEHRRQGTDPLTVAKLVGHNDVNSTLRYGRWDYEQLLKGAENHPLFSKNISPHKILSKLENVFDNLGLTKDIRFIVRKEKLAKLLKFEIEIA